MVRNLQNITQYEKSEISKLKISLYPTQSTMAIRFENHTAQEDYPYRILDNFGQTIRSGTIAKETYELNLLGLQDLPVGLYQFQLLGSDTSIAKAFSIQR